MLWALVIVLVGYSLYLVVKLVQEMALARRELRQNHRVIKRQIEILEQASAVSRYALPAPSSNTGAAKSIIEDLDTHRSAQ